MNVLVESEKKSERARKGEKKAAVSIHPLKRQANKAWWQPSLCTAIQPRPESNSSSTEHEYFSAVGSSEHASLFNSHTPTETSKKIMSF